MCTVSKIKPFVGYTHNLCAWLSRKPSIEVMNVTCEWSHIQPY